MRGTESIWGGTPCREAPSAGFERLDRALSKRNLGSRGLGATAGGLRARGLRGYRNAAPTRLTSSPSCAGTTIPARLAGTSASRATHSQARDIHCGCAMATPPPITMSSGLNALAMSTQAEATARAADSSTSRAAMSPAAAHSSTSLPVRARPDARISCSGPPSSARSPARRAIAGPRLWPPGIRAARSRRRDRPGRR